MRRIDRRYKEVGTELGTNSKLNCCLFDEWDVTNRVNLPWINPKILIDEQIRRASYNIGGLDIPRDEYCWGEIFVMKVFACCNVQSHENNYFNSCLFHTKYVRTWLQNEKSARHTYVYFWHDFNSTVHHCAILHTLRIPCDVRTLLDKCHGTREEK